MADKDGIRYFRAEAPAATSTDQGTRIAELEAQVRQLEARTALPEDAQERLVAVKGVGDKLAQEILEALQGK